MIVDIEFPCVIVLCVSEFYCWWRSLISRPFHTWMCIFINNNHRVPLHALATIYILNTNNNNNNNQYNPFGKNNYKYQKKRTRMNHFVLCWYQELKSRFQGQKIQWEFHIVRIDHSLCYSSWWWEVPLGGGRFDNSWNGDYIS